MRNEGWEKETRRGKFEQDRSLQNGVGSWWKLLAKPIRDQRGFVWQRFDAIVPVTRNDVRTRPPGLAIGSWPTNLWRAVQCRMALLLDTIVIRIVPPPWHNNRHRFSLFACLRLVPISKLPSTLWITYLLQKRIELCLFHFHTFLPSFFEHLL